MKEAYLTGVSKPQPEPPTMAEALAAIERSRALYTEANGIKAEASKVNSRAYELIKQAQNMPFGIMVTLGFSLGQVRRNVDTGEEVVVVRQGPTEVAINGLTKRRTVLHNDSRRIDPLWFEKWEDTGRTVKPDWRNNYYGVRVPKADNTPS